MGPANDEDDYEDKKNVLWDGEAEGFDIWIRLVENRCRMKGGLVKKIFAGTLSMEEHLAKFPIDEHEEEEEKFEQAEGYLYNLLVKTVAKKVSSTAYSIVLMAGDTFEGSKILKEYRTVFEPAGQ